MRLPFRQLKFVCCSPMDKFYIRELENVLWKTLTWSEKCAGLYTIIIIFPAQCVVNQSTNGTKIKLQIMYESLSGSLSVMLNSRVKSKWPEAVVRRCSAKMVFLEISHNSQENTCARVFFLIKLQGSGLQLY